MRSLTEAAASVKKMFRPAKKMTESLYSGQAGFFGRASMGKFYDTVYSEDAQQLTPQAQMELCRQLFTTNGHIAAGVITYQDIILGGGLRFESQSEALNKRMKEFLQDIDFHRNLMEIIEHFIVTGNAYIEIGEKKSDNKFPGIKVIPYPEKIYIDIDENEKIAGYIQRVDGPVYNYNTTPQKTNKKLSQHHVRLPYGAFEVVFGLELDMDRIIHIKYGIGEMGIYGQSPFASSTNDMMVIVEIARSIAVICRYKAIQKKIIMLKQDPEGASNDDDMDIFRDDMDDLADFENMITNQEIDIVSLFEGDLNLSSLIEALQYLSRRMTAPLVPEYLVHGETSTYAESKEQRIAFFLRVLNIREFLLREVKVIIDLALESIGKSGVEYELIFNDLDPMSPSDSKAEALELWREGLMTMDEVRKRYQLDEVPVYGKMFNFEVQAGVLMPQSDFEEPDVIEGPEEGKEGPGEGEEAEEEGMKLMGKRNGKTRKAIDNIGRTVKQLKGIV